MPQQRRRSLLGLQLGCQGARTFACAVCGVCASWPWLFHRKTAPKRVERMPLTVNPRRRRVQVVNQEWPMRFSASSRVLSARSLSRDRGREVEKKDSKTANRQEIPSPRHLVTLTPITCLELLNREAVDQLVEMLAAGEDHAPEAAFQVKAEPLVETGRRVVKAVDADGGLLVAQLAESNSARPARWPRRRNRDGGGLVG